MSEITVSPILTGAAADALFITFIQSISNPLGSGEADLTGTTTAFPPVTFTVVVSILVGLVHSVLAYSSPLLQVLPVTDKTLFNKIKIMYIPIHTETDTPEISEQICILRVLIYPVNIEI